jgi:hypothetical protein
MPPLQPGLPVIWCPTVVVFALAQQLRRCGLVGRIPRGLLDDLVAPWGLKRHGPTVRFRVPCDCGRMVQRLELTARGWACGYCGTGAHCQLEMHAARLLFGFRLGLRGRYLTRLHLRTVRALLGKLPNLAQLRRFQIVQAATVVVSYDPRTGDVPWQQLGPVGQALGGEILDLWLTTVASPVAYEARCRAEIGA